MDDAVIFRAVRAAMLLVAGLALSCSLEDTRLEVSFGSEFPDTTSGGLTIRFSSDMTERTVHAHRTDPLSP